ncbi:hypothetical protein DFH07DRAFT_791674 [Mycena maculata]|uniref:RING-type domain-containing protein n=1 Tax=Mycena maculata TaxID=230809 RepID=A0AAD7NZR7_9AGAR|nr:hypothetical protein DFH07DRAFT_791674 [Mycena maculata]
MPANTPLAELDEFDLIPDPFTGTDINWSQILATPVSTQSNRPPSPDYFADDSSLDEAFLAQLDMLNGSPSANPHSSVPQTIPLSAGAQQSTAGLFPSTASPSPLHTGTKRPRTPSRKRSASPETGPRRKRRKSVDPSQLVLEGFEEELACPICYDILVATHLLNPCGHSFCGECAWQWIQKNKKAGCPVCRAPLTKTPMVPNICMDKMVEVHLRMLCLNDAQWRPGGDKLVEFQGRQRKWTEREKRRHGPSPNGQSSA